MNIMYLCYCYEDNIISVEVINMLKNNYLSVIQFQLRLKIKCDSTHDFLVIDDEYIQQMQKSIEQNAIT